MVNRIKRSRRRRKVLLHQPPNRDEIEAARKLAKKVSVKLFNMMESRPINESN